MTLARWRSTVRSLENVSTSVIITCIVVTLWAGSWVFNVVERAINRLWGTRPRAMLRGRGLTLLMIGGVGVLLAVSIFFTSLLVSLREFASRLTPRQLEHYSWLAFVGDGLWQLVYAVVSVKAFDNVEPSLVRAAPASFAEEDVASRLARRQRKWIPDVRFVEAA